MKAIRIHSLGGPEVLKLEEVPDPQPGEGQAVVRIEAAGLNYVDVYFRTGLYPRPVPFVSGPFPKGTVTRSSMVGGRMLGINVNTKHPEEAWKLVKYLASEPIFTKYYTTQFPAQRSLLQKVDWSPELKGFAEQLGYARTFSPPAMSRRPSRASPSRRAARVGTTTRPTATTS